MGTITVGIDIGQKHDPTALCVCELEWRQTAPAKRREDYYLVRHLERLPLGTPYPDIAERLAAVVAAVRTRGSKPAVFADATGVGQPVVDLLRKAGVGVRACYFTHGDRRVLNQGYISLGKGYLVSRLQALLQTGRVLLPRMEEALALAKELLDYEIKVDEAANERYGAFSVGAHDDLATALGLAVQGTPTAPLGGVCLQVGRRPSPWKADTNPGMP